MIPIHPNHSGSPSPVVSSEVSTKDRRVRGVWRAFSFETGHFLLHVPSAHVLEVDGSLADLVRGVRHDPNLWDQLDQLDQELPRPPERTVKVDIQTVSLNLAQGCNLRCTYCFAGEGDYGSKGMMSHETAIKAIATLSQGRERFHVTFFGGEPLLNFKVIQSVVEWCEGQPCHYTYSMTTNGTLLSADKLTWLREHGFALTVSYDGPGLHGAQRLNQDKKSNSEALVTRKLEAFKEELGKLRQMRLRATVSKGSLGLAEAAIVSTLSSQNYRLAVTRHADDMRAFAFADEDIRLLGEIMVRIVDECLAQKDYARLKKLENIMKTVTSIHRGATHRLHCGAGVHYVTCSVKGAFYLCHRFNEDETERYGDIEVGLDVEKLGQIAAFRDKKSDPCATCWMRQWCAGGCFHEHRAKTGDKFALDPHFCQLQNVEMEQAMRVYTHFRQYAPEQLEP